MENSKRGIERVNLAPLVRELRANPDTGITNLQEAVQKSVAQTKAETEEARQDDIEIEEERVELKALAAILIDVAIEKFLAEKGSFPPYGIGRPGKNVERASLHQLQPLSSELLRSIDNPWEELQMSLDYTLGAYVNDLFDSDQNSPFLQNIIARYTLLHMRLLVSEQFMPISAELFSEQEDPAMFIKRGVGTSGGHMVNLLHVIPVILERENATEWMSPQKKAEVAKASMPLLIATSMLHLRELKQLESKVLLQDIVSRKPEGNERLNPERLHLYRNNGHVPRVVFNTHILKEIKVSNDYNGIKTGCPAHVKLNGSGSALEKLWDYICTEIAPDLYAATMKPEKT